MPWKIRSCIATFLLGLLTFSAAGQAQTERLRSSREYWLASAFFCSGPSGKFPSKEGSPGSGECDDGDMTLFNGLLCLSGEQVGCDAVKQSQGPDGRWWRSPRRIGWEAPDHDVSFSADQALGVFAYLIRTKDAQAFNRWIEWINEKRPCLITISTCIVKGWPRYCTDDQADKRCTLRPVDCAWIEAIAGYTDGKRGLCEEITSSLKLPQVPAIDIFVAGSAAVNKVGFPLHLAAVQILMLKALEREGDGAKIALQAFKLRGEPQNAFFSYVREDPMAVTSSALLSICPTKEKPSERRFQWAWERTDSEQAWKQSMYWDCVFVANLIVQR